MTDDSTRQDTNTIASSKVATHQSINAVAAGSGSGSGNTQGGIQPRIYINIPAGAKIKAIYINKG